MGKNPKHMLHHTGPGEITKSLSDKGASWVIFWNGRTYQRNIMHMLPYRPDLHVLEEQRAVQDNTITVGSYVAVLDDTGDTHYHVAEVVDMTDQLTYLHYLGTGSKRLHSAVWKHVYHNSEGGFTFTTRNEAMNHNRFSGTMVL